MPKQVVVSMAAIAALVTIPVFAQFAAEVGAFTSICIEDQAVGFNWKDGGWRKTNFKSGDRYIVRKLSAQEVDAEKPMICTEKQSNGFAGFQQISACYEIKDFGTSAGKVLLGEMCQESYQDERLVSIRCAHMSFLPDGPFIRVPWHRDINPKPSNDYKDSLVVSEGKCGRIK